MENSAQLPASKRVTAVVNRSRRKYQVATVVLLMLVCGGFLGPFILGDPTAVSPEKKFMPPGSEGYILGTDALGRDVFVRVIVALRVSILVPAAGLGLGTMLGVILGVISGYSRGVFGGAILRLIDIQMGVPSIILIILIAGVVGNSLPTTIGVLVLVCWIPIARVCRSEILSMRDGTFVRSLRCLGLSHNAIIIRHLIPNIAHSAAVISALQYSRLIMAAAALGFLGLGVPPPTPTIGGMISEGQVNIVTGEWWLVVVPASVIFVMIICVNSLAEYLARRLQRS